jgi:hypothetical protein
MPTYSDPLANIRCQEADHHRQEREFREIVERQDKMIAESNRKSEDEMNAARDARWPRPRQWRVIPTK